jgi:hypothetical protein
MSESTISAIIAGATGILGTLIGSGFSFIFEFIRRRWHKTDRNIDRKTIIVDKRCDQSEIYVEAVTADFRKLMEDIKFILVESDQFAARQRPDERKQSVNKMDYILFSLGPAITSLGDEQLKQPWEEMMKQMDNLQQIYMKAYEYRFASGKKVDINQAIKQINNYWIKYSRQLGNYYKRLDEIRIERAK